MFGVGIALAAAVTSTAARQAHVSDWAPNGLFGRWTRADEIVELRTECSKTFDNHDGTYSLVISGRLHRRDENGNWVELPGCGQESSRPGPRLETDDTTRVASGVGYDNEMWAADIPYFRAQHIYLSSELLFNGHIIGIGYFSDGDGGIGDTISMAQHWLEDVTYSTYNNTNWTGPGTLVWGSGTLTLPNLNGWVRLNLTTSFLHLHGNNLAVSYRHQDGTIERSQWYRVHSPGANRSKRGRSNSQNPPDMTLIPTRPDIELVYIPVYPDVQTTEIRVPKDTVVSGQSYTPQAVVKNNGPVRAVTFDVKLDISGGYSSTRTVTNLSVGSQSTVNFAAWTAAPLGPFSVTCSTRLNGDSVESNNRQTASGFVRLLDVQVQELTSPPATVDSGAPAQPRARIRNNGNTPVTFDARFLIGDGYSNTQTVSALEPGAEASVGFLEWRPARRGSFATRCTAMLNGDQVPIGNWLNGTVNVAVHDIGAVAIVEPSGPVCRLTPQARVHNYGTLREPCAVVFSINSIPPYSSIISLPAGLPVAVDTTLVFAEWDPVPGAWTARCSTALDNDQVPANDTVSARFTVPGVDIGVMAIRAPGTFVDTSMVVVPVGLVKNLGVAMTDFVASFAIESAGVRIYASRAWVAGLAVGAETLVVFDTWPKPHFPGVYAARCSVYAAGDDLHDNDTLGMGFNVVTDKLTYGWRIRADLPA
ncbi:MAG: CARDB domain-containing protein, partial [candidate division WOR-3 bacterium]